MINQTSQSYEFGGGFRIDPAERSLTREGDAVRLAPKVFDTLLVLLENRGRLVAKDELITRIWPDTFIEEATLARNISDLRKALGQAANSPKFIETIPKHGYRFVAPVRELKAAPENVVIEVHRSSRIVSEETETDEDVITVGESVAAVPEMIADYHQPAIATQVMQSRSAVAFYWRSALVMLVVAASSAFYLWKAAPGGIESAREVQSIAVLPFRPISTDGRDEYLELGMADALITNLSSINRVVVRPTSSVRKYAGLEADPVAAGRDLKVDSVLDGNVQRVGDRIRVRARLVRVLDGRALWTGEFDENSRDIFTVQDRISEQMARALALKLTGEEKKLLTKRYTENAEANQLYQKGRFFWNKRTVDGLNKGTEYFEQAIALDQHYALAYAGLADSYALLDLYGNLKPGDIFEKARAAAETALKLDNSLAEAHASLAYVEYYHDWNWTGAEDEFKRSIAANQAYATAHQWYAEYLFYMARFDESIAEINRAHELDPISLSINTELGSPYYYMRRYDIALEKYRAAGEMDPSFPLAGYCSALCLSQKNDYKEAIRTLGGEKSPIGAALGYFYARAGRTREARDVLSGLIQSNFPPTGIARVLTGLEEKDQALDWLEKAFDQRDERIVMIKVDPHFDSLRSEPRFQKLLGRLGLL